MEVPQGYKQTSIGVIPEDWEISRLAEICSTFRSGNSITSENIFSEGDFPVFGGNGFRGYTNSFTHSGEYILIGRQGALCGNIKYIQGDNYISEHAIAVQPNQDHFLKFWYYKLDFMKLNRLSESSAQPGLSVEKLGRIRIPLPSLPEQQKIAEILSTWDTAIETCKQTIEQLKQRNKGLAQQLLSGKKRLEGFEDKEWNFVKFKEFYAPNKKPSGNAKFELLSVTKNGIVSQEKYFNKSIASEDTSKYLIVERGDFVVSGLNFWMGSYDVLNDFETGMVSPAYKVFRLNEKYSKPFFKHLVASRQMKNAMISSSVVGASIVRRNFDLEVLYEYAFKIPEIDEQEAIGNVLDAAQEELKIYEGKLHNLQQQKKGLMQQLLTGKVRTVNL